MLNSYAPGYDWTDSEMKGVMSTLRAADPDVRPHVEFMDWKSVPGPATVEALLSFYRAKYAKRPIRVVLTTDDAALDFALKHRREIFPAADIVFCGVNDPEPSAFDGYDRITGVVERADHAKTLELVRRLHPKRQVLAIVEPTLTGNLIRRAFERHIDKQQKVTVLQDVSMEEVLQRVRTLDDSWVVILLPFARDRLGNVLTVSRTVRDITRESRVPVYGTWDFQMGHGIVGGNLVSGELQGQGGARLALLALEGDLKPINWQNPSALVFDYHVMKRFNIARSDLPAGAQILHEPEPFLRKLWRVWLGGLLVSLVAFLGAINLVQRRAAFRLRESEERLKTILEKVAMGILIVGMDQRVRWANHAILQMAGSDRPEDLKKIHERYFGADGHDRNSNLVNCESVLDRSDGTSLPVLESMFEITYSGEQFLLVTLIDLTERKHLEAELVHARKLEAVGQLAAGIAHEINTPAQFLGDSLQFLKEAFEDQHALLHCYREALAPLEGAPELERMRGQIEEAEEHADLDYLEEHVPKSFEGCVEGIQRIAEIVSAMKEFGHPDQREKGAADLNKALSNSLTIALNEYKYVADVETDFGDLPYVQCHLGDINQVFLNLIVNAAHAIAEHRVEEQRGKIRIKTTHEGGAVVVEIQDTGGGIPQDVSARVFDPFFTTKEVGKGTGQGLAIARSIVVDKHNGELSFESEAGKGTTFRMSLPVGG